MHELIMTPQLNFWEEIILTVHPVVARAKCEEKKVNSKTYRKKKLLAKMPKH